MRSVFPLLLIVLFVALPAPVLSQKKKTPPPPSRPPLLLRTTTKHELKRFAYGGTLTIVGAPEGSITVEGWPQSEVDISAEIQLRADTEADLDLLATVNTIVIDEDMNHIRVLTTGTHDKAFMRAVAKKFPKTLLGLPWKVDYRVRVPFSTDLEINAGRGAINLAGVEGSIQLSGTESEANLTASSGTLLATIAVGKVNLSIPMRSWRGVGADIRVAVGEVTVELPVGFNGDINAEILHSGQITDSYGGLEPREKPGITPQLVKARAGSGGASFQFTVGDGKILFKKQTTQSKSQ
ncbi:MAG TPA: hypothetical protein VIF64_08990 [Pyrinomonadaceae bacterium]|jgi:hypothetical protein